MGDMISINDLRKVTGIGPKTIERIEEELKLRVSGEYISKKHLDVNKIYHGDMLNLIQGVPDNSVDLLLTDPPYRIIQGGATNNAFTLTGGSDYSKGELFKENTIEFKEWAREVYRVQKEETHAYIFTNDRNMQDVLNEFTRVGYKLLNILPWTKNTHSPNRYYLKNVEYIVMFRKGGARNINNMGSFASLKYDSVASKVHPSQKPESLLAHLIGNSSMEGDIVLDPFIGSGSTMKVAKKMRRRYIGFEKDISYFDVASKFIESKNYI